VKKYSDWVVDGEYDWPPICLLCNAAFEAGTDQTTRLGCLRMFLLTFACILCTHIAWSHILKVSHLKLHLQDMCVLHVLPL
ncbi:hypothetical protein BHM03_00032404, partial [Ensete ventricosum]